MAIAYDAVDCSQHGGELPLDVALDLYAKGVDVAMVATGPGNYGKHALQQLETFLLVGIKTDIYYFLELTDGITPEAWIDAGLSKIAPVLDKIEMVWIDVEDPEANSIPLSARIDYVDRAIARARFVYPKATIGIYTGRWYWIQERYMANIQKYKDFPLWNSYYSGYPARGIGLPYGGWLEDNVWMHQFAGTTEVDGFSFDLSKVYRRPEKDMALVNDDILRLLTGLSGKAAEDKILEWNKKGNSLIDGYSKEQVEQGGIKADLDHVIERLDELESTTPLETQEGLINVLKNLHQSLGAFLGLSEPTS